MGSLVRQTFRMASGRLFKNSNVVVAERGSLVPLQNLQTDDTGTVNFYMDPGQYDYIIDGRAFPFDVADPYNKADVAPILSAVRLEARTLAAQRVNGSRVAARHADAVAITEPWANTTAWAGTGTVLSNRMYTAAGLTRAAPTSPRWTMRATLHATGVAGKFAYIGLGSSSAGGDLLGIGQGSAAASVSILRGANLPAASLVTPRALPALPAGDYLCTVSVDEAYVSLTLQTVPTGQNVYGARFPRSAFPGAINTIFLSANDTVAGGLNWGPLVIYPELGVPPVSARVVGGYTLFGATRPLVHLFADPISGFGRVLSVPGDNDPRVPMPVVEFLHQASTGVAIAPWTEARMAGIVSGLENAGYALLTSDNGPGITGGGTQDKFANAVSQQDYVDAVEWVRQRFNTGALCLLGPSQGSFVAANLVKNRALGGIAAVATISGGTDLKVSEALPAYQAGVRAAYGATSSADFATKVDGYNPIDFDPVALRGVPFRFYVGTADTTSPPSVQIYPFADKIAPYVPEAAVISAAVDHLDASLYQASDLLSFFNRYI